MSAPFDLNDTFVEEEGENDVTGQDEIDLVASAANVLTGEGDAQSTTVPTVGMLFDSGEQFAAMCYTYAYKSGFEIQVRSSQTLTAFKEQGVKRHGKGDKQTQFHMAKVLRLGCNQGNTTAEDRPSDPCKMFVHGKLNEDGMFEIITCNLDHNHDCLPDQTRFVVHYRNIGEYFKRRMMLNDRAGIPINRNFNALLMEAGGYENLPFNDRDMRNAINRERRKSRFHGDAKEVLIYFDKLKSQNPDFFYAVEKDEDDKLLNIFWADARCRAMYKVFGDAVSFDSTHSSNRYKMPFCPFVGVNQHGNTIVFASALISYEDQETFEWVFKQWNECMGQAPVVLLTDQCKAMEGAIKKVFPETKHRLCLWHILQNADTNLTKLPKFAEIDKDLRTVVHESFTEDELIENWEALKDKYNLHDNTWLNEAWAKRHRWIPYYWMDTMCAGMSSTQRSEQTNRLVKVYVSINTNLRQFMDQHEWVLKNKVEEENKKYNENIRKPEKYDSRILFEDVYSKVYTNKMFKLVKQEVYGCISTNVEALPNCLHLRRFRATSKVFEPFWKKDRRTFEVTVDTLTKDCKCGCRLFEFKGILCRHIMKCMDVLEEKVIPAKYILDRWRKDLVRGYENIRVGYYDPEASERVKRMMELSEQNDYIMRLAFQDERSATIFKSYSSKVIEALEANAGIQKRDSFAQRGVSSLVYGRRRTQEKDCPEQLNRQEGDIRDPPDKRGSGRKRNTKQPKRKRKKNEDVEASSDQPPNRNTTQRRSNCPSTSYISGFSASQTNPTFSQSQHFTASQNNPTYSHSQMTPQHFSNSQYGSFS
ncbi:hypothetical protein RND81_13G156600 [Saponaria officinalis]|uniref:SWIM-type domain-containing protein n=1 Tax=Saponaria officinalis TaxID=3572 RepID=A0AAW1H3T9_SAPOF